MLQESFINTGHNSQAMAHVMGSHLPAIQTEYPSSLNLDALHRADSNGPIVGADSGPPEGMSEDDYKEWLAYKKMMEEKKRKAAEEKKRKEEEARKK